MSKKNTLTVNINLENRKIKNGLFPIALIIYFNGIKKRQRRNLYLSKDSWHRIQNGVRLDQHHRDQRIIIEKYRQKAIEICNSIESTFTFAEFETLFFEKKQITGNHKIEGLAEIYIKDNPHLAVRTKRMYRTAAASLGKFKKGIVISELNETIIKSYIQSLQKGDESNSSVSGSTVQAYLRHLKALCLYSKKKGLIKDSPFDSIKIGSTRKNKRALSTSQLRLVFSYKSDNEQKTKALDFWKLSYLLNGMNFIDICNLKNANRRPNGVSFFRKKNGNKFYSDQTEIFCPISDNVAPLVDAIFDKYKVQSSNENDYIFPILNDLDSEIKRIGKVDQFIKTTNLWLGKISLELGLPIKLTTYYSRHTYASQLKRKGVDVCFISESLGHSSIKTTEIYLSSIDDDIGLKNSSLLLDF